MNIQHKQQKAPETRALELMAVVFSMHPSVQTKVFPIVASPIAEKVQLASSSLCEGSSGDVVLPATKLLTDTRGLLQQCQKILYSVYYREMGWRPNSNAHTQFEIDEEKGLFCDRYDETAIWTAIIDPSRSEAVGCMRLLPTSPSLHLHGVRSQDSRTRTSTSTTTSPDLDILGYSGCPSSLHDWVLAEGRVEHVFEGQRFAIAADYRRFGLPYHLMQVTSKVITSYIDPKAVCVASVSMVMVKYVMASGGIHDPKQNWTICYEEGDPLGSLPIFTLDIASISPLIAEFYQARCVKEQRERLGLGVVENMMALVKKGRKALSSLVKKGRKALSSMKALNLD